MTGFKLDRFKGIVPRLPATLLEPTSAAVARNCDFAYGELRNTAGNLAERTLSIAAKSIYTDDGNLFYSWPIDVNAVRSPMAADKFNRLYYSTPTDMRVTRRNDMAATGGEPIFTFRIGVPKPTVAPTVTPAPPAPVSTTSNAGVLPVFTGDGGSTSIAYTSATFGSPVGTVSITLAAAGSVAVIANWQAFPNGSSNFNTGIEVQVDGAVALMSADSGLGNYVFSHAASSSIVLAAGTHTFSVRFNNSFGGSWHLGRWGAAIVPVTVAGDTVTTAAAAENVTRAYVYTYVNIYDEESAPSPAFVVTSPLGELKVNIPWPGANLNYVDIREVRVYRTPDASTVAEYFYVGSVTVFAAPAQTFVFNDKVASAELNEPLASQNYYPPDPALIGLMSLPNGILMAWKGNEMHFSDAYKPWSWPPAYVLTFGDYSIVGAIAVGASVLVTTTGKPFMVSGVSPDSMTNSAINIQQAGASKWALADLGGQIVYASHDGIVAFDGGLPTMAFSDNYFTREVWRQKYAAGLDTMRFAVWDGRLIVYSSAAEFVPFLIGLDEARGAMTELPDLVAQCSFVSPVADQCFIANGAQLLRFAAGGPQTATWTSRINVIDRPRNYSIAQAVCSGAWTVQFYADGVLRHTQAGLSGTTTFRLPAGYLSDRWQVTITGTGSFLELRVGESAADLKAL